MGRDHHPLGMNVSRPAYVEPKRVSRQLVPSNERKRATSTLKKYKLEDIE